MIISHKIRLKPNNKQTTYLAKAAGTARFAYNWALAEWQTQYAAWQNDNSLPKPNQMRLRRQLNHIKREKFGWMLEVTKNAPQMAIIQLGEAFKNFFAGRANYPKFKKKGKSRDSFTLTNDQFKVEGLRIRIPHIGRVRMRESLRFNGKILSVTVSRTANQWFASITVDTASHPLPPAENQGVVGVDLGVSALATLSTGEVVAGAKPHKILLSRLQRLSRSLSRKVNGSENRKKAKLKLARLHARVANVRRDALHRLTTDLTRRFHTIGIEGLNVSGMVKNRYLSRAISDMGFFECRRQLAYKAAQRGGIIVVADRWYPSSKTCSDCGHKLETLRLAVREWVCPACGAVHDRDMNAAINLKNLAVSSTVSACGEAGAGLERKFKTKPASVKQESSSKATYG